jgi:hypothetical protein
LLACLDLLHHPQHRYRATGHTRGLAHLLRPFGVSVKEKDHVDVVFENNVPLPALPISPSWTPGETLGDGVNDPADLQFIALLYETQTLLRPSCFA